MKNFSLSILAVSSIVVLGACSSNSDGGHKPTTPMVNPSNPDNPTNPTINQNIMGQAIIFKNGTNEARLTNLNANDINHLNIDGKVFHLSGGMSKDGFSYYSDDNYYGQIGHLNYARYGYLGKSSGIEYSFYQGERTPVANMPNQGVVNYLGHYIYGDALTTRKGRVEFKANFTEKTMIGTSETNAALNFIADIKGNTFVNDGSKTGIQVDGAFFGNNAEELSGIYMDKNEKFAGAFGAKK